MEYGLIGEKLGHSFSKEIHEKISDYSYSLLELQRENLESFFLEHDFRAINVTIPYKEAIIPFLHEISESAKSIGSVNTVVNKDGKLFGYNTDYFGAVDLIRHAGITVRDKKVLILGTGGTSKTMRAVARDLGAREIIIVSRREQDGAVTYEKVREMHSDAEVIINTTPVGMYPNNDKEIMDLGTFTKLEGAVDVIYNPLESRFVKAAKAQGAKACGGLYMLVAQAVYASALFRGVEADPALIEKTYREILREKQNLILIGMPSSGKTTVGKEIAEKLGRDFVDTDCELVKREGREIPEIIGNDGEAEFRNIESAVVAEVSGRNGIVISTGGGVILREENVKNLSQTGIIFFLDRPLELLIPTDDRPLSNSFDSLKKRYEERYDLYKASADYIIKSETTASDAANSILEVINNENSCN